MLRPTATEQQITFEVIPREVPLVCADQGQVRRAIMNIVKNAVEASLPEESVRIWCSVSRDGQHLVIHVQDFGAGIPGSGTGTGFRSLLHHQTDWKRSGDAHYPVRSSGNMVEIVELSSKPDRGTLVQLKLPLGEQPC